MILKNTELAQRWQEAPFPTLSIQEYGERVADFLEHLSPTIYLERLCATATHSEECLAPDWSKDRWRPHNQLREILEKRGCIQGSKFSSKNC
jgi:radical SAM superfamily enzyme